MPVTGPSVPNPEVDAGDYPADHDRLVTLFDRASEYVERHGKRNLFFQKKQDEEQAEAKQLLAYLRDPVGVSAVMVAMGQGAELEDLRALEAEAFVGTDANDRLGVLEQLEREANNNGRPNVWDLEVTDKDILKRAGYGQDVHRVLLSYEDSTLNPADLVARRLVVIISHDDPKVSHTLEFELWRGVHTRYKEEDKYSFGKNYHVRNALPLTTDPAEIEARANFMEATGEGVFTQREAGQVERLITLHNAGRQAARAA